MGEISTIFPILCFYQTFPNWHRIGSVNQLSPIGLAFCPPISVRKPVLQITLFKLKTFKCSIFFSTIVNNKAVWTWEKTQLFIYSTLTEYLFRAWSREFLQFSHFQMGVDASLHVWRVLVLHPNSLLDKEYKSAVYSTGQGFKICTHPDLNSNSIRCKVRVLGHVT